MMTMLLTSTTAKLLTTASHSIYTCTNHSNRIIGNEGGVSYHVMYSAIHKFTGVTLVAVVELFYFICQFITYMH